jgi:hypothetical protein
VITKSFRSNPVKFFSLSVLLSLLSLANILALTAPTTAAVQGLGRPAPVNPGSRPEKPDSVSLGNLDRNLPNGVYLFSDAEAPNQAQRTYFVFQVQNQQVVGALYTPGSSFDCFYGTQKPGNLDVKVMDSYESSTTYNQAVVLTDYYRLTQVSTNDQRLLQSCRVTVPVPAQLRANQP